MNTIKNLSTYTTTTQRKRDLLLQRFSGSVEYSTKANPQRVIKGKILPGEDSKGEEVIFVPDPTPENKRLPKQFAMHMDTFEENQKLRNPQYKKVGEQEDIKENTKKGLFHEMTQSTWGKKVGKYAAMTLLALTMYTQTANNQSKTMTQQTDIHKEYVHEQEKYIQRESQIDNILKKYKAPIESRTILKNCTKYKVPVEMAVAILWNESHFGTIGKGSKTNNPGNVIEEEYFPNMETGVEACIKNIGWRINEFEHIYGHRMCTVIQLMENKGPDNRAFLSARYGTGVYAENPQASKDVEYLARKINIKEYPKSYIYGT